MEMNSKGELEHGDEQQGRATAWRETARNSKRVRELREIARDCNSKGEL
jgi:hypothetical protein